MKTRSVCLALSALTAACGPGTSVAPDTGVDSHDVAPQDVVVPTDLGVDTGGGDDVATDTGAPTDASDGGALTDTGLGIDGGSGCGSYAYCDDFETYGAGTHAVTNGMALGPWQASVANATMQLDSMRPHHGTHALHITVPANAGARATLHQGMTTGLVAGNDLFGRAMVYYATAADAGLPLAVHSWIFNASGHSNQADGGVSMNMGGGGARLQLNYQPVPPRTEQSVQGGMVTAGAWHCVQWQYNASGTPPSNTAHVWIDGVMAISVPASMNWIFATPWTGFDFGFTHYQTLPNAVDLYLDEFALDHAMVPCPT